MGGDSEGKALEEMEVVKTMITKKDYIGARTKLHELRLKFPALNGISGMITVCDVLSFTVCGLFGGKTNWYWVLQVMRTSGEADIRSQFYKLKKLLDPIKSSFPGTESALKVIQDAFSVLSDPETRAAFDLDLDSSLECGFVGENVVQREDFAQLSVRCRTCDSDAGDGINEEDCSKESSSKRIVDQGVSDHLGEMEPHNAGIPSLTKLINGIYDAIEETDACNTEIPAQIEFTNGSHADEEQRKRKVISTGETNMVSASVKRILTVGTEKPANSVSSSIVSDCSSDKSYWSAKSKDGMEL